MKFYYDEEVKKFLNIEAYSKFLNEYIQHYSFKNAPAIVFWYESENSKVMHELFQKTGERPDRTVTDTAHTLFSCYWNEHNTIIFSISELVKAAEQYTKRNQKADDVFRNFLICQIFYEFRHISVYRGEIKEELKDTIDNSEQEAGIFLQTKTFERVVKE